jgi:hypothetical protein
MFFLFNLKGGLWIFVSFRIFFSDNTRVRIFNFLSRKVRNFYSEFNIRLYDKNSESDYYFFPPTKSEYFFQQHWESEYFLRLFLKPFLYFNILSIIWQLLLSVKWRHLFSCEVKTRPIYGMETNI